MKHSYLPPPPHKLTTTAYVLASLLLTALLVLGGTISVQAQGGENCSHHTSVSLHVQGHNQLIRLRNRGNAWDESRYTTTVAVRARGGLLCTGPNYQLKVKLKGLSTNNWRVRLPGTSNWVREPSGGVELTLAHNDLVLIGVQGHGQTPTNGTTANLSLEKVDGGDGFIAASDYHVRGHPWGIRYLSPY